MLKSNELDLLAQAFAKKEQHGREAATGARSEEVNGFDKRKALTADLTREILRDNPQRLYGI